MKILYVATISGTINAFLIPHIKTLVMAGHQVDVACNQSDQLDVELMELGSQLFEISFERSPFNRNNWNAYKQIDQVLADGHYDIVHTHTPVASAIVRLASRKYEDTQVFYTAHGYHIFKGAPLKNWLIYFPTEYILSRWTDLTITINSEDFALANRFFKTKSNKIVQVDGVGINVDRFVPLEKEEKLRLRRLHGFDKELPLLMYVGELSFRKNQAFLIDVIASLVPETKLLLLLVGGGPLEEDLKQRAIDFGIQDYVRFMGRRDDVPDLFGMSDICVSSSRQEGLAVNLMEAMGAALPLVVTDVRGNRDLVRQGENGYIVPEHDTELFASHIKELIDQPTKRVAMGRAGRQFVETLDIHSINQVLLELYQASDRDQAPDNIGAEGEIG